MTENTTTLVDVKPPRSGEPPEELPPLTAAEQDTVRDLVRQARAGGTSLTGPGGLLKQLTKMVVEAALDEEMSEHLGYDNGAPEGRNGGNSRNGKRTKTVVTDNAGPVEIVVPRDRDGTFEPVIVPKRARRLSDLDAVVLSLSAKGLTHGEISAHFADVYGASVSEDVVGRITDRVVAEMQAWWARPLEKVYAAVFIDAIMVKVRDGQVRNRPVYAAIAIAATACVAAAARTPDARRYRLPPGCSRTAGRAPRHSSRPDRLPRSRSDHAWAAVPAGR